MRQQNVTSIFIVVNSLFISILLSLVPIPQSLQWLKIDWVVLVLIYWIVNAPNTMGIVSIWIFGLFVDIVNGYLLGQSALVLSLVGYLGNILRIQLHFANVLQQTLVVLFLVSIYKVLMLWIQMLAGRDTEVYLWFWLNLGSNTLIWPFLALFLQRYQRKVPTHHI